VPADIGVRAALAATFSPSGTSIEASSGLQMRGPFRDADGLPLFLLKNVTAGVFSGDRYDVSLITEPGASARVAGSSATKVYAMPGGRAESHLSIRASAGSRIVYDASPLILQARSDTQQTSRIVAEPGATVAISEIIVFGRLARGERFAFRRFTNELTIARGANEPACYTQRYVLTPDATISEAIRGYGVLGTMIAAAPQAVARLDSVRDELAATDGCNAGVSGLPCGDAVIVQMLGERADAVARTLRLAEAGILRD
jgi:urease accessory protein